MPLYEYECASCGHRFERIQKSFSDPPMETCPDCGGPVHKLVSSPAFQFKGSGFYATDYARKNTGGKSHEGDAAGPTDASKSDRSEKTDKSEKSDRADKSESAASAPKDKEGGAAATSSNAASSGKSDSSKSS